MTPEEKNNETLLLTIRAQIEREEDRDRRRVIWHDLPDGPWKRIDPDGRAHSGLIRYFTPEYQEGFDPYGQPLNPKQ
jgi:hypothetical protein